MIENFLDGLKKDLQAKCLAMQEIPMTTYSLAAEDEENGFIVSVNEFALEENVSMSAQIIENCILGTEWDSNQCGLKPVCTVFAHNFSREDILWLVLQIKIGGKMISEVHKFISKGMQADENGKLRTNFRKEVHRYDLTN